MSAPWLSAMCQARLKLGMSLVVLIDFFVRTGSSQQLDLEWDQEFVRGIAAGDGVFGQKSTIRNANTYWWLSAVAIPRQVETVFAQRFLDHCKILFGTGNDAAFIVRD